MRTKRPNSSPALASARCKPLPLSSALCAAVSLFWLRLHLLFSSLSRNVLREIASFDPPLSLLAVCDTKLHIYNMSTGHYRSVKICSIPSYSDLFPIDALNVFAFPGQNFYSKEWNQLIRLSLKSLTTELFPQMLMRRWKPLLIVVQGIVYVFGGFHDGEPLQECEKASLQGKVWLQLPHLPRIASRSSCFSPVHLHHSIYLPDRGGQVDVLDLRTEVFTCAHFGECCFIWCYSFLADEELVILGIMGAVKRWNLRTGQEEEERTVQLPSNTTASFSGRKGRTVSWLTLAPASLCCFDVTSFELSVRPLI